MPCRPGSSTALTCLVYNSNGQVKPYLTRKLGIRKRNMPRLALFAHGGSYLCRLGSGELWCMVVYVHGRWLEVYYHDMGNYMYRSI